MRLGILDEQELLAGAIYGFAFGDAWGRETEFMPGKHAEIQHPQFPHTPYVSDDTQMHLYTLQALKTIQSLGIDTARLHLDRDSREIVSRVFADTYLKWLEDQDNNELRAPGTTCLDAMRTYRAAKIANPLIRGTHGAVKESKGCGTVMRAGWLGLTKLPREAVINLALIQSQTTHGHTLAGASAAATAVFVQEMYEGRLNLSSKNAPQEGRDLIETLLTEATPNNAGGWDDQYREGLQELLHHYDEATAKFTLWLLRGEDPTEYMGEGWVAEEAFTTAYLTMTAMFSARAYSALSSLVWTNGDSDTLAAIGGMFYGLHYGVKAFPEYWRDLMEPRYLEELDLAVLQLL